MDVHVVSQVLLLEDSAAQMSFLFRHDSDIFVEKCLGPPATVKVFLRILKKIFVFFILMLLVLPSVVD